MVASVKTCLSVLNYDLVNMTDYIHPIIQECFNQMCPQELAYAAKAQNSLKNN